MKTGEVLRRRFGSDPSEIVAWVRSLPQPAAVTYEAGPTGFALARLFTVPGISCLVAAPSKLQSSHVSPSAAIWDVLEIRDVDVDQRARVRMFVSPERFPRDSIDARVQNGAVQSGEHRVRVAGEA